MEVGFIGLGRMGQNMAARLAQHGHTAYGFDLSEESRAQAEAENIGTSDSLQGLAEKFNETPRVFWLMVPAGKITDSVVTQVGEVASPGDIVVDGGNTFYKDSIRHAKELEARGVRFVDCGTSGGIWGLRNGYCLMIGGAEETVQAIEPLLLALTPPDGYAHVGPTGAGHFVKMVHNGIEYGLLQAYAEGFELLHGATEFDLDLHRISHVWNQGSVVRSWLLELAERAFESGQEFEEFDDDIADNGTGRWTVQESIDRAIPLPVITLALQTRFRSRQDESYAGKVIAALRNQFGGHAVVAKHLEKMEGKPQPSGGKKDL
ncbi:MAG: decarboxylating 6-phosphogluconate dehydrogenase [Capsulimonadales bacterium]|nr:decarboxylating 6-phosphogluconate dehydrogenase [Capsulimonadales bacterium]